MAVPLTPVTRQARQQGERGSVFFNFRAGLSLYTGCRVSNKDLGPQRGGSVSFMALYRVTANAVFARWPVMDGEAIQYTSFLVLCPGLDSPSYLPSVAFKRKYCNKFYIIDINKIS